MRVALAIALACCSAPPGTAAVRSGGTRAADNHRANTRALGRGADPAQLPRHAGAAPPPGLAGFPFKWRCRAVAVVPAPGPPPAVPFGPTPSLPLRTQWHLSAPHSPTVSSNGSEWSPEANFTAADAKATPAKPSWWQGRVALVNYLTVATTPAAPGTNGSLTSVECQVTPLSAPGGTTITLKGLLFGTTLGLMVSYNTTTSGMSSPVQTMADFNTERHVRS